MLNVTQKRQLEQYFFSLALFGFSDLLRQRFPEIQNFKKERAARTSVC